MQLHCVVVRCEESAVVSILECGHVLVWLIGCAGYDIVVVSRETIGTVRADLLEDAGLYLESYIVLS